MIHNILAQIKLHWLQDAVDLYFSINVIAVGCRVMGWARLADELSKIEKAIQAMVDTILNRGKAVPIIILCLGLSFSMGCASYSMHSSCGHLVGSGTYATANANGAGFMCHIDCLGNCPKPVDYSSLVELTNTYVNASNAVTTTVPITVSVTPTAK